jgi:nucleotide-binding universal stress UspA family protein
MSGEEATAMNVRNVLYPTDFSTCASRAFGHAAEMARTYGARLHLLHVIALHSDLPYDPMFYVPAADVAYERAEKHALALLCDLATSPAAADVGAVVAVRRALDPGSAILAYVEEQGIDLVVMGTHGRSGAARLLLGGRAEEVVRHSSCPVLTLRMDEVCATREVPPHRILVPFDFSGASRVALQEAAELARRCGARVRLLHVLDAAPLGPDGETAAQAVADERARRLRQLRLRLQDILDYLAPGIPGEVEVRVGRPADQILIAAQEPEVDLAVMATRGTDGLKRLLFGSTAEQVLRLAGAPVLVVKPAPSPVPAWEEAPWPSTSHPRRASPTVSS